MFEHRRKLKGAPIFLENIVKFKKLTFKNFNFSNSGERGVSW